MKIVSWNLNHRTIEKPIPNAVVNVALKLAADVLVLSEYVDGSSRALFNRDLARGGYEHQTASERVAGQNQILVASRLELRKGDLRAPQFDDASRTNFLHVQFNSSPIEVVGFRAPAYKIKVQRDTYWRQFREIMMIASERPICFVGDANYDPFAGAACESSEVRFDAGGVFHVPRPSGEWSFVSTDGTNRTRIDHAFLSSKVRCRGPQYVTTLGNTVLAGPTGSSPVSDHAVLAIELQMREEPNKALEPTPTSVMSPAAQEPRQP